MDEKGAPSGLMLHVCGAGEGEMWQFVRWFLKLLLGSYSRLICSQFIG